MKTLSTVLLLTTTLLGACGGNAPEATTPAKPDAPAAPDTKAADPTAKPVDATAAKPADAKPATDAKPADAKPTTDAKPADAAPEAKCKEAPKTTAKDAKGCMAECSKLEATAPAGSKCIPQRTACEQQCKTLGK